MRTVACEISRAKRGWIGPGRCNSLETAEARLGARLISWRPDRFFECSTCAGGFVNKDQKAKNHVCA
jgi:hypothetical protein